MQTGKPACCRIQTGGKRQRTDDGAGAGAGAGTRGILVQNLTPTRLKSLLCSFWYVPVNQPHERSLAFKVVAKCSMNHHRGAQNNDGIVSGGSSGIGR